MLENQAVWKSNNQGFKEATVIQMGKKNGDVEIHRETWKGVERCRDTEIKNGLVPHPHVVDKNQEGYVSSKGSQPHTRPPSPGFQHRDDKSP